MNVDSSAARPAAQLLAGEVRPALAGRHAYRAGPGGQPFALPGMSGLTLGVHCGDPAAGYACDHLEPGASVRHRDPGANMALQFLACVGNQVRAESGPAAARACGPGWRPGLRAEVPVANLDPAALDVLPVTTDCAAGTVTAAAEMTVPSELAGHGPGIAPVLTGPAGALRVQPDPAGHTGLAEAGLRQLAAPGLELQ